MYHNPRQRGRGQQHRMPDQEAPDLSMLHPLAQDASHISVAQLTKSEQVEPWVGQRQDNILFQPLVATPWQHDPTPRPYARTEPLQPESAALDMKRIPSRNPSDADSGYISQPISTGAEHFDIDTFTYKPECFVGTAHWNYHIETPRDSRKPSLTRCPQCERLPKNHSDAKKHAETHFKRWKCEAIGCTRNEGFATLNDLERHRKSVHSLRPSVGSPLGYICQACVQAPGGRDRKFWPRRDNFKAHIRRRHRDCDEAQLLEVSRTQRPDDAMTADVEERSVVSFVELPQEITAVDTTDAMWRSTQPLDDAHHQSHHQEHFSPLFSENFIQEDSLAAMGSHAVDIDSQPNEHPDWPMPIGSIDEHPHQQLTFNPFMPSQYYMVPAQQPIDQLHVDLQQTRMRFKVLKHIKRHTRPYGCTFPLCNKIFGSRNDWKRHELTQHQTAPKRQLRSRQPSNSGRGAFSREVQDETATSFWRMDKTDLSVVTEARMQHVGDHYDKDNRVVDEWVRWEDSVASERGVKNEFGADGMRLGEENAVCKREQEHGAVADVSVWRPAQRPVPDSDVDCKFRDHKRLVGREDEEDMDAEGMSDSGDD
ncbi:hypothetical protein BST61_g9218 [Cercospora zeina]